MANIEEVTAWIHANPAQYWLTENGLTVINRDKETEVN